jgi:hypothetical protein
MPIIAQSKPPSKAFSILNLLLVNIITIYIVMKNNWDLASFLWFLVIQIIVDTLYSMYWLIINYYKANTSQLKFKVKKSMNYFFLVFFLAIFVIGMISPFNKYHTFDFAVFALPGNIYILSRLIELAFTYFKTNTSTLLYNTPLLGLFGRIMIFLIFAPFSFTQNLWTGENGQGLGLLVFIIIASTFYEIVFKYFPNVVLFKRGNKLK